MKRGPCRRSFEQVTGGSQTNVDMLAWFSDSERDECRSCGERTSVSVEGARASFCLACGSISIDGELLDL